MPRSLHRMLSAGSALLVVLGAGAWMLFLSGQYAIAVTHGVSMEPTYHQGALVLVQRKSYYAVGEIAAYQQPGKDLMVLHRIIGGDARGFTFKGDNNASTDPTTPPQSQLIGRAVLHIPGGGTWFRRATSPEMLGGLAFLLVGGGGSAVRTRRSRRRRQHMSKHSTPPVRLARLTPGLQVAAAGTAALALGGLALAAAGWSGPTATRGHEKASSSTAAFSYHAQVPRSAAYDGTVARSPDPVFRRLAQSVDVHLAYAGPPGSVAIRAELSTASGWHTTLPLARRVDFTGRTYEAQVTLDLRAFEEQARAAAVATGMPAEQLDVQVVPDITAVGGLVFSPRLGLTVTPLRLTLSEGSALVVKGPSDLAQVVSTPRVLHLWGATAMATTVRTLSLLLLGLALLCGFATLLQIARRPAASESARMQQRYAGMLLSVQPMPATAGRPIVDVTEFAALVKLAERYGLLILHWTRSDVDTYIVQDDNTTYRFRPGSAETPAPTPGQQSPEQAWSS